MGAYRRSAPVLFCSQVKGPMGPVFRCLKYRTRGVSPNRRNFRRALPGASISPEVLEPIRREFGIAGGVLDVAVAQVMLDRPCVLPVVGQLIAGGVP